jgi:hypothetical protein
MKKIIYIFGLILMTIALNSCQDWLDTESESVFTEESTFSNLEFASKAVFGIYQVFTLGDNYGYYYPFTLSCHNSWEKALFRTIANAFFASLVGPFNSFSASAYISTTSV